MPKSEKTSKTTSQKSKDDGVIVSELKSNERSSAVLPTGDAALDEVLTETGAGATDEEMDVEAPDASQVYEEEIKQEAEKIEPSVTAKTEEISAEIEPTPAPKLKKHSRKIGSVRKAPLHGKKYRQIIKDLDLSMAYSKVDAIDLVKKTSYTKFDGSVEAHIKMSISNQRGIITLPAGTGRERKIMAVTSANVEDKIKEFEAGKLDFDVLLATPDVMSKLAKVARILGPKGLMPNPKSGTVTADVEKAKTEFGSGRVEYKQDKGGVIHLALGRVSFDAEKLLSNLDVLLAALPAPKIVSVTLSATMGPGVKVQV